MTVAAKFEQANYGEWCFLPISKTVLFKARDGRVNYSKTKVLHICHSRESDVNTLNNRTKNLDDYKGMAHMHVAKAFLDNGFENETS